MAATVHEHAWRTRTTEDGAATGRLAQWRAARRARALIPVEARFFDAYCRGGIHQHERLALDYDFVARPRVRAILHEAVGGQSLNVAELEAEYLAWDNQQDLEAFRRNVAYLASILRGRA